MWYPQISQGWRGLNDFIVIFIFLKKKKKKKVIYTPPTLQRQRIPAWIKGWSPKKYPLFQNRNLADPVRYGDTIQKGGKYPLYG